MLLPAAAPCPSACSSSLPLPACLPCPLPAHPPPVCVAARACVCSAVPHLSQSPVAVPMCAPACVSACPITRYSLPRRFVRSPVFRPCPGQALAFLASPRDDVTTRMSSLPLHSPDRDVWHARHGRCSR